ISEIAFTPLHTGSEKVGFVTSPPTRSLAQCTALTGAGCLDAISLSMQDHVRVRFWLEVLNLAWGDFILFEPSRTMLMKRIAQCVPTALRRTVIWWTHRSLTMILLFVCMALFCMGLTTYRFMKSEEDCTSGRRLIDSSVLIMTTAVSLSFFSYLRPLHGLSFTPVFRQIQQATRYVIKAWHPPNMLYVTDGGVQDCTAITQLLQRRCEVIMLVLAASDPTDDLAVLRTTMEAVQNKLKLASFYDLQDPRRNVFAMLDDYKQNSSAHSFKMGIRYGWNEVETPSFGTLWVVKNRLPDDFLNQTVQPHLREEEIMYNTPSPKSWNGCSGDSSASEDNEVLEELLDMQTEDLGGLGCCDCCHRWGNCGRKFPHLTFTGYMWLTPQLCSSLARLGHALSQETVAQLKQSLGPGLRSTP
ncbi:unnamed protein product, partial [Effrenium voratum]